MAAIPQLKLERTIESMPALEPDNWQSRLLPLMRLSLIALSIFFFVTSCVQLTYLNREILKTSTVDANELLSHPAPKAPQSYAQVLQLSRLHALVKLEADATTAEYHQAEILLVSRIWATYLGFVTGMILAFVGATFVLGKLQEEESSSLTTKSRHIEVSFKSASPGLVLAVLGVTLMICTILTHNNINVVHHATYVGEALAGADSYPEETLSTPEKAGSESRSGQLPPPFVIPTQANTTASKGTK